jgi:phosphoribosylformimino-5-aminoimidazole carboxamide ribotide isomerase
MRVIAVLDLMGGHIVRGVAGRRHEYRPIISRLSPSSLPIDVAKAIRDRFHLFDFYLADLDAIAGAAPAFPVYQALQKLGLHLWVDAGVRRPAEAAPLAAAGLDTIVLGLETVRGPETVATVCHEIGPERSLLSLDLKNGRPLGDLAGWQAPDSRVIADQAIAVGVQRLLVLDLARVGSGSGTGTESLCRDLASRYPGVEITAGGGIRSREDLVRLQACGVQSVLVASALHDEQFCEADWASLQPVSKKNR